MIKLYDDQKLEIIKELKKYYTASAKYIEELREKSKTQEWLGFLNVDGYETQNNKLAELITDLENDFNTIDDEKWNSLLVFVNMNTPPAPYRFDDTLKVEDKDWDGLNGFNGTAIRYVL